jgi:2-C-methyl-D-erythritol 4-phosphate cytidylyltransferase/2-C-methyl-D-erythritol 2,4-cyclodiphosphate synthase
MTNDPVIWGCIIVAAGRGERFGGSVPKQFLELGGRTLLQWSLDTALSLEGVARVCLVLPAALPESFQPGDHFRVCSTAGGDRRRDSVANGLRALEGCTHVLVHDAARPLASRDLFQRVMDAALEHGAAVPVIPVVDTLKRVSEGLVGGTVDRRGLFASQTPQGFRRDLLCAALESEADFTDESQALEESGSTVMPVDGEMTNMKLTAPADLSLLRSLAGIPGRETRTALGLDFHPFDEDRPMLLCGCRLADEGGLKGHSDGDAALHSIMDAMLSASRQGDIGTLFPPSDPGLAGADSSVLLERTLESLRREGWRVETLDLTIIGERPRISEIRSVLRERLAGLLQIPLECIWVKGTTTNSLGSIGRGEGLGALASVSISRAGK